MAKKKTIIAKTEEVEVTKVEATVKEVIVESKELQFKNEGEDVKIRLGNSNDCKWLTVKTGQTVSVPRNIAKANKLKEVK